MLMQGRPSFLGRGGMGGEHMAHKGMKGSKMSAYTKGEDYAKEHEEMGKMMKPIMGGKKPKK